MLAKKNKEAPAIPFGVRVIIKNSVHQRDALTQLSTPVLEGRGPWGTALWLAWPALLDTDAPHARAALQPVHVQSSSRHPASRRPLHSSRVRKTGDPRAPGEGVKAQPAPEDY